MTSRNRLGLVALALIVAIVAFVLASSSSTSTKSARGTDIHIRARAGKAEGRVQSITAKKGGRVRFSVTSDRADEIHVHGYELKRGVPAGGRSGSTSRPPSTASSSSSSSTRASRSPR